MWPQRQRDSHNPRMPQPPETGRGKEGTPPWSLWREHSADSLSIETDCRGIPWLWSGWDSELSLLRAQVQSLVEEYCVVQSKKKKKRNWFWNSGLQICTRINVCYFNPPSLWSAGIQRFITLPSLLVCLETFLIKLCLCVLNSQHYLCNNLAKEIETELGNSTTSLQNIQKRNRS